MKVYGIARLTKDLELQTVGDNKLLKNSIAWNGRKRESHFHDIVVWNRTAERMAEYLHKGSKIFIEGTLENNNYTKQDGTKVYQNVITVSTFEFIEPKTQFASNEQKEVYQSTQPTQEQREYVDNSSELPF